MSVRIVINGNSVEAEASGTIAEALNSLNVRSNAYLYLINGVPVPSDTVLKEGMEITAMKVASGG
jgi:sulfur carrier protein